MAEFTAKDVQALRQATGAGMMDAKKALTENNGEFDAASKWLREQGLAKAANREDRANTQGAVAVSAIDNGAAIAELKCETDFVAKSDQFTALVQEIAALVAASGEEAASSKSGAIDSLKLVLKENIDLGRVIRIDAPVGHVIDTYLHRQDGRGVNGVIVELDGGTAALAHEVAVHIAFSRPRYLQRSDVPQAEVDEERQTLTSITRAEGKPEAALDKIVEGRLTGWFRDRVLLEQQYVKDEKQTITQLLGGTSVVRFAQVVIGLTVSVPRWKRIVLKLSGEAFAGPQGYGIEGAIVHQLATEIVDARGNLGVDIAVVVGGGNIWRGMTGADHGMDRAQADQMGMLATIINALALQDTLEQMGQPTRVQSAVHMAQIAEPYIRRRAMRHLEKHRVVILAGGLGSPFFTTDTPAALRAAELSAEAVLKGTHSGVDGVYTADPKIDPHATKLDEVSYLDVINRGLNVMDPTSITFCMDNKLPIVVFDALEAGNLRRVLEGEDGVGTLVR